MRTARYKAAAGGHEEIVHVLLVKGADPSFSSLTRPLDG